VFPVNRPLVFGEHWEPGLPVNPKLRNLLVSVCRTIHFEYSANGFFATLVSVQIFVSVHAGMNLFLYRME
jgi:hypothetical protein